MPNCTEKQKRKAAETVEECGESDESAPIPLTAPAPPSAVPR